MRSRLCAMSLAVLVSLTLLSAQAPAPASTALTDAEMEQFLLKAKVVKSKGVSKGVTASLRATLVRAGFDVTHLTTMRDETDPSPLRRTIKLAAGAVERQLDRGPLIEAFGVSGPTDRRAE